MTKSARILVVDDDPDIVEMLEYNLTKEGYEVATALNGEEALKIAPAFRPQLVLLDVMMPVKDGIATCRELRKVKDLKDLYIIFLTARIEEYSEIEGFSAGADDYITKPIKPGALLSRIAAALKKQLPATDSPVLTIDGLKIDRNSYEVEHAGQKVHLARKEFELLYMLASEPGKVFSRDAILEKIWGNDVFVGDRTVDVHIRKIREKLDPHYISTIKGVGYKFEP